MENVSSILSKVKRIIISMEWFAEWGSYNSLGGGPGGKTRLKTKVGAGVEKNSSGSLQSTVEGVKEMEEMEKKWAKLHLTKEEDHEVVVDDDILDELSDKGERNLVGRVTAKRNIGRGVIESTMAKVWKVSRPASFREVRSNVFVITFATWLINRGCGKGSLGCLITV